MSVSDKAYHKAQHEKNKALAERAHEFGRSTAADRAHGITVEILYDATSYLEQRSHSQGVCRVPLVYTEEEARELSDKDPLVAYPQEVYVSKIREFHIREKGRQDYDFYFAFGKDMDKTVGRAFDFMVDEVSRSDIEAGTLRINMRIAKTRIALLNHQVEDYVTFNTSLQHNIVQICQASLWRRIKYLFTGGIRSLYHDYAR